MSAAPGKHKADIEAGLSNSERESIVAFAP